MKNLVNSLFFAYFAKKINLTYLFSNHQYHNTFNGSNDFT